MRVSFVIPTRNHARFIRKCIDSCRAQQLDDAEIIVVDGDSTDGTQQILAEYGAAVRWISEPDSGQSDALSKGIDRATGEIIAWINSDDYYVDAGVLRRVLQPFEDPRVDLVYGDGVMVDGSYRIIRSVRARPVSTARDIVLRASGFVLQPSLFFRRKLYLDAGGVDKSLHWTMDYELWIRMFRQAQSVRYLPEPLACAVYHKDAKSIHGMLKQIREFALVKRRYRDALSLGVVDRLRIHAGMASLYAYWVATQLRLRRAI